MPIETTTEYSLLVDGNSVESAPSVTDLFKKLRGVVIPQASNLRVVKTTTESFNQVQGLVHVEEV
jgi:hypothetical protein